RAGAGGRSPSGAAARPAPQLPRARPPMNVERTIETRALVTPNRAIASRSHTTSRTRLQNPETRKNPKSLRRPIRCRKLSPSVSRRRNLRAARRSVRGRRSHDVAARLAVARDPPAPEVRSHGLPGHSGYRRGSGRGAEHEAVLATHLPHPGREGGGRALPLDRLEHGAVLEGHPSRLESNHVAPGRVRTPVEEREEEV